MKPKDVTPAKQTYILRRINKNEKKLSFRAKYKTGDHVRVSKMKHVFEKGYTPN